MNRRTLPFSAALVLATALGSAEAASYDVIRIDVPGFANSNAWDVNGTGRVIVNGIGTDGIESFVWSQAGLTPIQAPAGATSVGAIGTSDGGVIVGQYTDAGGANHGFVLDQGNWSTVDLPGATNTLLRGISPDGRYASGSADSATGTSGFVYDRVSGSFTSLDEATSESNIPQGISVRGVLVGSDDLVPPNAAAVRVGYMFDLTTSTRTDLSVPGMIRSSLRDIDSSGRVVGFAVDPAGITHGIVGSAGQFEWFDYPGAYATFIEGTNDAGWLSGIYDDAAGNPFGFVAIPVPEPVSGGLLGMGLLGLAIRRRGLGSRTA